MPDNKGNSNPNKGNKGGHDGGVSDAHKQSRSQQQHGTNTNINSTQFNDNVSPYQGQATFIPPYPGPNPTYFVQPGGPGPMYRPYPTHNQDNGLYELIQEMNSRLKVIEHTVSKIVPIEKDVTSLKCQVSDIQDVNKTLTTRISDVENFCQTFSDIADDFISSKRKLQDEISNVKSSERALKSDVENLQLNKSTLKDHCLDIQTRAMENNLLFFGIDEARPKSSTNEGASIRENTENVLRSVLRENLQENADINQECPVDIASIQFDKVIRLGNPDRSFSNGRPRPVMAKFERYSEREAIRRAGILLNKSQRKYKIYEHFPRDIEERRKKLYPIARAYTQKGCKVSIVRDKMYFNHLLYNPETNTLGRGQRNPAVPPAKQFPMSNAVPYNDKRQQARPGNPPGYYSQSTQSQVQFKPQRQLSFESPNPFRILAQDNNANSKRKAGSPLDVDYAAKRVDPGDMLECDGLPVPVTSFADQEMLADPWAQNDTTM